MKIGIVVWDLNISGGTQRQAIELARNLQNKGHEIFLYSVYYNDRTCFPELLDNLNVTYLIKTDNESGNSSSSGLLGKLYSATIGFHKKITDLLNLFEDNLDLLNVHDYLTYFVVPHFKRKYNKPVVWMMNDLPLDDRSNRFKKSSSHLLGMHLKRWFVTRYINKIDKIVVLDNWNKDKVKNTYGREAIVVRSGLDIGSYEFKSRGKNKNLVIFSNGIFFPWRRFEDLITALKIIQDKGNRFEFHHVGSDKRDPEYASKIYDNVREYGLEDNVTFHGFVSERMLIDLYSMSDVFVFPNYPQTWGLAVFEAMACGTPVICSTGAGAHEVLSDGYNSILVPPKDPQKIAESLIRLYSDDELWHKLHLNGRKFVEENITWDHYAENMMDVFNESLKGI